MRKRPSGDGTKGQKMANCKACGAPIVFIQSEKNMKWIPLDEGLVEYKADEDGEDLVVNQKGEVIRCTFEFQCDPDGLARIPHWATCPFSDKYRRR